MRKYDMAKKYTRGNVLYFVLAWNAFGLAVYSLYKKRTKSEEWAAMSPTQKYISMMHKPDDEVKHISVDGINIVENKVVSVEEWTTSE